MEWISVEDRLPPDDRKVLCCGYGGAFFIAADLCAERLVFRRGSWRIWEDKSGRYRRLSHWMELPAPPEGHIPKCVYRRKKDA